MNSRFVPPEVIILNGSFAGIPRALRLPNWSVPDPPGNIRDRSDCSVNRTRPCLKVVDRFRTAADIRLLAEVDETLGGLCGPTTRRVMRRQYEVFGDERFERLAGLSNSHLYRMRQSTTYRRRRNPTTKTRATQVSIGERRKPHPQGRPGFLRVDSVHQGDLDGRKGVYEVNLVDEVTQYEFVAAVEGISERFLVPALEALIEAFPFEIKGFHADNGSEYINYRVARLLRKLHVEEFTKSRPHRSNDNALVESKNASVVRRHLGHAHIARRHAALVNGFLRDVLAPYLNYHRPCHFPVETTDSKGRTRKRYPFENVTTPYLKLKSLDSAQRYLRPGVTFEQLDSVAVALDDLAAARLLNAARDQLFRDIERRETQAA